MYFPLWELCMFDSFSLFFLVNSSTSTSSEPGGRAHKEYMLRNRSRYPSSCARQHHTHSLGRHRWAASSVWLLHGVSSAGWGEASWSKQGNKCDRNTWANSWSAPRSGKHWNGEVQRSAGVLPWDVWEVFVFPRRTWGVHTWGQLHCTQHPAVL